MLPSSATPSPLRSGGRPAGRSGSFGVVTATGVTARVVGSTTIMLPLVPETDVKMMLPLGSTSIPSALTNPGVGTFVTGAGTLGFGVPSALISPPGGSEPPGPRVSLNWTSEPAPEGAVVLATQTAVSVTTMSLMTLLAASVSLYAASSAPVVASNTNSVPLAVAPPVAPRLPAIHRRLWLSTCAPRALLWAGSGDAGEAGIQFGSVTPVTRSPLRIPPVVVFGA